MKYKKKSLQPLIETCSFDLESAIFFSILLGIFVEFYVNFLNIPIKNKLVVCYYSTLSDTNDVKISKNSL